MEAPYYYGTETHGYCRKCGPPRRMFFPRPIVKDGMPIAELNCPLHGVFKVEEDSLDNLSGSFLIGAEGK